jgi:hypothetical protein
MDINDNSVRNTSILLNNNNNINDTSITYNDIRKMVFVFNALNDGWTVKKIDNDKYEFLKDKEKMKEEIVLEDYLKNFIKYNINIK